MAKNKDKDLERLELENRELKRQVRQIEKKLKQVNKGYRKARDHEDDLKDEPEDEPEDEQNSERIPCTSCNEGYLDETVFTLVNGKTKSFISCKSCGFRPIVKL